MTDILLIPVSKVKELCYAHDNILPKTLTVGIKRVQHVMLRKLMGAKEYDAFVTAVSNSPSAIPPVASPVALTPDQVDLLENYIHPYLAACIDYKIIYPLTFRARSKSVGKGTDENHEAAAIVELIRLKDELKQDIDAFAETLREKLNTSNGCDSKGVKTETPWDNIKFR